MNEKHSSCSPLINKEPSAPALVKASLVNQLIAKKKLALIIDLDKTLIDTMIVKSKEDGEVVIKHDETHRSDFLLFELSGAYFLVRFRPYLHEFLESLLEHYMLCIYTFSQRSYASIVLNVIDPDHKYFEDRILCQDDLPIQKRKYGTHAESASEYLVLALDDSSIAWTHENGIRFPSLIQIEPFIFFMENGLTQNRNLDNILPRMSEVLLKIHKTFFDQKLSHASIAIQNVKSKVLEGCEICIDKNFIDNDIDELSVFGAHVHFQFVPYATHIIAQSSDDEMVKQALQYSEMFVVTNLWWKLSYLRYEKMNEKLFEIPGIPNPTNGPKKREFVPLKNLCSI